MLQALLETHLIRKSCHITVSHPKNVELLLLKRKTGKIKLNRTKVLRVESENQA